MLLLLLVSLCLGGSCLKIPIIELCNPELTCAANITRQYFAETKHIVYMKNTMDSDVDILLKSLHSMEIVSFNRMGKADAVKPNLAYMIVVTSVPEFLKYNISHLVSETNWNPDARFLIIFKLLRTEELRQVFDIFLHYRVYNVVVLNGTLTTELYTYNSFENFACGRYYTRVIYYGKCSNVSADIYPNKATTGLRNCFFNVSVPYWPPWGIDPSNRDAAPNVLGTEQYIFHLMAELEQFKYKFNFDFNAESFSTVFQNLSVSGPLIRLVQNHTDVMLGGMLLLSSRAIVFTHISGHLDYIDEIRVIVQRAGRAPAWKDIYFEFSATVWALLILALLMYSALLTILLKTKDKGHVVLVLLDILLSHGPSFRCRQSVKCVVIIWVIFATLVNSFYTTTLMSLTTKPSASHQISNEDAVMEHRLEPCISLRMGEYLKSEHNHGKLFKNVKIGTSGCVKLIESINTVSKSNRKFTIVLYSVYFINRQQFCNQYGIPLIYSFAKPYAKVIYAIFFNKGFPMKERLRALALRIREVGLAEKVYRDQYYNQTLKHRFRSQEFVARFAIPWYLYATGLAVSTITFVVEIAARYKKAHVSDTVDEFL